MRVRKAYLAGMIDGEGTVGAHLGKDASVRIFVAIFNTYRPCLEEIQKTFGGKLYTYGKPRKPHHKQVHYLSWTTDEAIAILRLAYPYMLIKHRHASVIFKLFGVKSKKRMPLILELSELNRRGIKIA